MQQKKGRWQHYASFPLRLYVCKNRTNGRGHFLLEVSVALAVDGTMNSLLLFRGQPATNGQ